MMAAHDGDGPFGPPMGAEIHLMNITYAGFHPRDLHHEWSLRGAAAIGRRGPMRHPEAR